MPKEKTTKEKILEEFDKKLLKVCDVYEKAADNNSEKLENWEKERKEIKQFISQTIDQTREETIREIRKQDEEELIKIVDKLKLDVETRIAFKNLKPESVGYNKCALKVQIKIKQIKQLIKNYYDHSKNN